VAVPEADSVVDQEAVADPVPEAAHSIAVDQEVDVVVPVEEEVLQVEVEEALEVEAVPVALVDLEAVEALEDKMEASDLTWWPVDCKKSVVQQLTYLQ